MTERHMRNFGYVRRLSVGWRTAVAMLSCVLALVAYAHQARAANPLGIAYADTTNVPLYGQPGGMLIAGRCNRNDPAFAQARRRGAEVLVYVGATERPDQRVCALDNELYLNDTARVPLWPYPSYGERVNYPNTHLTDMRPGSPWILHVVDYVEQLMRDRKVDGVFLDVMGARLWGKLADWDNWPQAEKDAWTDGNVDLVRRLDERRRAIDPDFIIVTNGYWDRGDQRGFAGERYVDGIMLEHPKVGSRWHIKNAGKPFSDLGHRRVLVVAADKDSAQAWANVQGVTNVSDQAGEKEYEHPNAPPVLFTPLHDRKTAKRRMTAAALSGERRRRAALCITSFSFHCKRSNDWRSSGCYSPRSNVSAEIFLAMRA